MVQGIPSTAFSVAKPSGTYPCAASKGNHVNFDVCSGITQSLIRNRQYCTGCLCPWRLCTVCIEQGFTDVEARIREGGPFCDFHRQNGMDARRDESEFDLRKKTLARERQGAIVPNPTFVPAPKPQPKSISAVGEERWPTAAEVADLITDAIPARELQILRLLSVNSDMPDVEMAERLDIKRSAVDTAMNRLARHFKFPILQRTDVTRVSRRRAILGEGCEIWMQRQIEQNTQR